MESSQLLVEARKRLPGKPTKAAVLYMVDSLRITKFVTFTYAVNLFILENMPLLIQHHLNRAEKSPEAKAIVDLCGRECLIERYNPEQHEPLFCEILLCKYVDNFILYLSELLREIFRSKPEILRSGDQERLDFVLQFETMEEFIEALVERKVERLAFLGIRDLNEFFKERLGFALGSKEQLQNIHEAVEIRNIIVHNRGVISPTFKRRLPSFKGCVGEPVNVDYEMSKRYCHSLEEIVRDLDRVASLKFGLATYNMPPIEEG